MPFTKEQAKEEVRKLVEHYKKLVESGEIKKFNEAQTKAEFIEPLFEALNWNMRSHNEVTLEEKISKKRADYCFWLSGIQKFFLEAKALEETLELEEIQQSISYSYWKWVTWAVLTNFKELHVYNALWAGGIADKRFIKLSFDEYLEKFDLLWYLSKDSFTDKSIDKFAEDVGKKTKKTQVTPIIKEIFDDMIEWRGKLTMSIMDNKSNVEILKNDEELLEECVQRIIDRLIFIRVVEDKDFEKNTLMSSLLEWKENKRGRPFIKVLNEIFRDFDKKYNSKLFSEHVSEKLTIDDLVLYDIIYNLYKSDGIEYKFDAIGVDVLGNIYEEYLGHILKKGKKKSTVTKNHLIRREMGIYYTPTFVVNYIVKNTLGEILKQKGDGKIKVLDPACGSGSFLIKAFDIFLNYYGKSGEIAFEDKEKILKNNIFGVDLDSKAVEIAQLNLLLRALEKGKRLPLLQGNIKVGNSLINDPKVAGGKAFDWDKEFESIVKEGGFDVIIGNPPYIDYREIEGNDFIKKNYFSAQIPDKYNILILFIERGLKLLKENGRLGFIVSNQFLVSDFGKKIREYILKNSEIEQILDLSNMKVFKDAATYPVIIILRKVKSPNPNHKVILALINEEEDLIQNNISFSSINQSIYENFQNNLLLIDLNSEKLGIINKLKENSNLLKDIKEELTWGTSASGYGKKKIDKKEYDELSHEEKSKYIPMIQTADMQKYFLDWQKEFLPKAIYSEKKLRLFGKEKIVIGRLNKFFKATIDTGKHALGKATLLILKKEFDYKFILGILNSKLIDYYYKLLFKSTHMQGGYVRYDVPYLELLPIKKIVGEKERKLHDEIIALVDEILKLNINLQKFGKLSDKSEKLQEEINRINKEIDQNVYKLYDLTPEEIKIVESS